MKKLALFILTSFVLQGSVLASTTVFSERGKFGLKNEANEIVAQPKYKKLIKLGETAYIMQSGNKFGILSASGEIVVKPKFPSAERVLGRFVKFSNGSKYGLYDEYGFEILPVEFSSIDLLYGGMFLTGKNYKYGVCDLNGQMILDNVFDDIYMPQPNKMILVYNGQTYEIERVKGETLTLPQNIAEIKHDDNFKVTEILSNPMTATGYYSVSATNYLLKIFSSISPAYEETIDELMFSKGADTVFVIMKCSWMPKFPVVYAKKYYQNLIAPNNGPLSGVKYNLKNKMN